jgi:tetratricopeptide (TPR) repeat protein
VGNADGALKFYRMALELDPGYALVYNDIGVILEAQGLPDRAEEYYLAAIKLDPKTLGAYSNLALFYENKRELEKAASYWRKRVELGSVGDPWTQKARKRLADLTEVVPSMQEDLRQRETEQLAKEVMVKRKAKLAQVDTHVAKAKKLEQQNKYSEAMNELYTALTLDPKDQDAAVLMDKIQRKILEEKKRARVKEIEAHYKTGLKFYEQNDSQKAKQEFDKANALAAPVPQR